MAFLNKDFCLWLVSPQDGRVKKFRFSLARAAAAGFVVILFTAGFLFLASDYTRLQFLRAKHYFSLTELQSEAETLQKNNHSLKLKVRDLSAQKLQVAEYEKQVKEKLNRLAGILSSAKSLGILEDKDLSQLEPRSRKEGIGGSELDCLLSDKHDCIAPKGVDWDIDSERAVLMLPKQQKGVDLVGLLDRYIAAMRVIPFLQPALAGEVTSRFGLRISPFSRLWKIHQGIDIGLDKGSAIYATAEGTVQKVKYSNAYGLYIDVAHTLRVSTRYAHLSKALVKPGQKIEGGDIIGLSGSTGRSTGPHLHYEVRVDGKAKNPERLFQLGQSLRAALEESRGSV